jgi:hypothetical protein
MVAKSNGRKVRLQGTFVESPLVWAVAAKTEREEVVTVADLFGKWRLHCLMCNTPLPYKIFIFFIPLNQISSSHFCSFNTSHHFIPMIMQSKRTSSSVCHGLAVGRTRWPSTSVPYTVNQQVRKTWFKIHEMAWAVILLERRKGLDVKNCIELYDIRDNLILVL